MLIQDSPNSPPRRAQTRPSSNLKSSAFTPTTAKMSVTRPSSHMKRSKVVFHEANDVNSRQAVSRLNMTSSELRFKPVLSPIRTDLNMKFSTTSKAQTPIIAGRLTNLSCSAPRLRLQHMNNSFFNRVDLSETLSS